MKIFAMFSIAFIVLGCLLAGCGGDEEGEVVGPGGELEEYWGFASMEIGSWAEHVSPEGDTDKYEYLGEDTWEGQSCFLMEIESNYDGEETISQIWIDKTNGESVLFLLKMDEFVMRMDLSQVPDVPGEDTVEDGGDEDDVEKIGTDSYTTPTGRTVQVTIYKMTTPWGTDEFWVSSEVPFGDVKDISDGELISSLYDFGHSGADRSISKQEAENAESFGFPFLPAVSIIH